MPNPNDYRPVVDEQLKIQAAGALVASGNSAAMDLGVGFAPGGGGMPFQIAVKNTALVGTGTYSFKVQDSPDNSTWTDRTPAVVANAVGVILLEGFLTARYVRLVWTIGGTSPSVTLTDTYLSPLDS